MLHTDPSLRILLDDVHKFLDEFKNNSYDACSHIQLKNKRENTYVNKFSVA